MDEIIAFPGPHGSLFTEYVRFKRSLGYAIANSYQYVLRHIALFIAAAPPEPGVVSHAAMEHLTSRRPGEATPTQCKRIAILRQFCLWLASTGHAPAVPPEGLARDTTDFVPRIVSETEMAAILAIADRDASEPRRLLLRLLWCCGMRIGEACALTVSDIDTRVGTVLIRHAKGDRTRLLPISETLREYAADYLGRHQHTDGESPLMPTARGNPPRPGNAGAMLTPIFGRAGVLTRHGTPIRPHDYADLFGGRELGVRDRDTVAGSVLAGLPRLRRGDPRWQALLMTAVVVVLPVPHQQLGHPLQAGRAVGVQQPPQSGHRATPRQVDRPPLSLVGERPRADVVAGGVTQQQG